MRSGGLFRIGSGFTSGVDDGGLWDVLTIRFSGLDASSAECTSTTWIGSLHPHEAVKVRVASANNEYFTD